MNALPARAAFLALALAAGAAGQDPTPAPPAAVPAPLPKIELPSQSLGTFNRFGMHSVYMLFSRRPVLVVSWRADEAASNDVVPAMLALAQREGDDLALLFVERSRLPYADMLRFVARKHWLCGSACWTCEVPPGTELQGTPSFVLTSVGHEVVLAGDPLAQVGALAAAADRAVEERRSGSADMPAELRAALAALNEGQFGKALTLAAPLDVAQRETIAEALDLQLQSANEMLASGYALEAQTQLAATVKSLGSLPEDDPRLKTAKDALAVFDCGDWNKDLKAGPTLAKLQDQLCTRGPSASLAQLLRGLAKANDGTALAKRALALAEIAQP
jgi:hypothetical protein